MTGSAATPADLNSVNTGILNPVARKIAGFGITVRREVLYTLADLQSASNHYLLKTANVFDRTLRAKNTQAQAHLLEFLKVIFPFGLR